MLATQIRQDDNIHGVMVKNEEIKLTLFADDMTCLLNDLNVDCWKTSINTLVSGSTTTKLKSSQLVLLNSRYATLSITCEHQLRYLIHTFFDHHKPSRNKANFESIFKAIQRTLNMWKWRGLTLLRKIQIVDLYHTKVFEESSINIGIKCRERAARFRVGGLK